MKPRLAVILPAIYFFLFGLSFSRVLGQDYSGVFAMFPFMRTLFRSAPVLLFILVPTLLMGIGVLAERRGLKMRWLLVVWIAAALLIALIEASRASAGRLLYPDPAWRVFVSAFYCAALFLAAWALLATRRAAGGGSRLLERRNP